MLESTLYLRDSTRMSVDPFSDILKFTRAESLVTGGFTAGGPWALRFPAPDKIKFFAVVKDPAGSVSMENLNQSR